MKWAPDILDALFCDKKDHLGLYYWYEVIEEKRKFSLLKKDEKMKVTYLHTNGN